MSNNHEPMNIETALEIHDGLMPVPETGLSDCELALRYEAHQMAHIALLEKAKRDKGCGSCNDKTCNSCSRQACHSIAGGCTDCEFSYTNGPNGLVTHRSMYDPYDYCPICGRKLI